MEPRIRIRKSLALCSRETIPSIGPTKWRRFSIWNHRSARRESLFFCVNPKCHINNAWYWSREDAITPKGALWVRRGNQSFALIYSKLLPCAACLASHSHEPCSTQQLRPTSGDNVTYLYLYWVSYIGISSSKCGGGVWDAIGCLEKKVHR